MANTNQFKINGINVDTGISGDGITSDNTLVIKGATATNGGSVEIYLNGTLIGTFTAPSNGASWSFDYTGHTLADGNYTIHAVDVTSGSTADFALTVDTTVAAPGVALAVDSGSSNTDHITNNGTLALTGVETGATVQYSTNGGSTWTSSFTAAQGSNTVLVRQTDVAGNVSSGTSFSFTLDTTAPAAPSIALTSDTGTSNSDKITSNGAVTVTGVESGATVQYSTNGGSTWSSSFAAAEGSNTVLVRQTDAAGNTGATSSLSFTLDTTAPVAPTVALTLDTGSSNSDHITKNGALTVSGTESGATVQYSINGGSTWSSAFSAVEGSNTVLVRQMDTAGNVSGTSSLNFTLDTTAPAAPTIALTADTGSSNSDHVTSNGAVTITGTESGASVQYSTNGGSTWSSSFTAAEGSNSVLVRQTDAAGNTSSISSLNFTVDTIAPTAPTIALTQDTGSSNSDHITSNGAVAVTGVESGASVQYSTDGGATWSNSFTAAEGSNSVLVHQVDVAGNVGANTSLSFTLDTTAPSAPSMALAHDTGASGSDGITSNGALALSGVESGASVQYSTDNGTTWSGSFSAAEGNNSVLVRQTDVAGNTSATSSLNFTLDTTAPAAPTVALATDTGSSSSDHITSNGALDVSGLESGASAQYSTDGGATWSSSFTAAEGSNSVLVRQTDVAGNVGTSSSLSFTLDTVAPDAPAVVLADDTGSSGSDSITSNGALAVTGVESGATVAYSIDNGTTWSSSFTATEGSNTVLVRQTDVAGNVGTTSSVAFTLDTTAPDSPVISLSTDTGTSSSDGITNVGTLNITGVESGAAVAYSTDGGATWNSSFSAAEGSNSVLVRQTDVAGNTGATSSLNFALDTTAPAAPGVALSHDTGASGSDSITNNGALDVTGLENGASVQYSVDGGTTWSSSFTAAEGNNSVQVRQTDVAGNMGASTNLSFTLDTIAPDAPSVALANDTGASGSDSITSNGALDITGIEAGASVQYSTDGGTNWSDTFAASEGANNVLIRQTDTAGNAGNASSISFTLDTIAPTAPTVALDTDTGASDSDGITSNGALVVGGTEAGASVEYSTDGGTTWSSSFTAAEGSNSVLVHQIDVAGNVGTNASLSFTLDTTAPSAPSATLSLDTGASDSDGITSNGALTLTGVESGATVAYSIDGGTTWSSSFTAAEGSNSVLVRQTDVAGNTGTTSSLSFTLDTTAPIAPTVGLEADSGASNSDGITNVGTLSVTGVESGATVAYSTDGGNTWSSTFTAAEGSNTVLVRQTDIAGNAGDAATLSFTLDTTAPTVPTVALAADTGSSNADSITSDGTLALTGVESGASVQYSIDNGATWSSSFSATEGSNSVLVRQTDVAGNVGTSGSLSFTLDTTAPTAPTVALATDTGASNSDGITSNGTLNVTGLEAGASAQYSVDGGNTWSSSFTAAEGSNTVLVRQTDVAGNTGASSSVSFTLDTHGPVAPTLALASDTGSSGSDHITKNGTLNLSGIESGATVAYSVDGGATWSSSFSAVEGSNAVLARQTDVAGNIGATSSLSFTLDTTAPNAPTVALAVDSGVSNSDHITNNGTLALSGIESGATVQYSVDGGNTWNGSFTAVQGSNSVMVHETDVAGNISAASSLSFILDTATAAPAFTTAQLNGSSSTMTMGGTSEANSVVTIYDLTTGKVAGTATTNSSGAWTFTTGKVSGIHTFNIAATDTAGNTAHTSTEAIIGTMGNETIRDVSGQNDILSGAQGIDTFVFGNGFGNDIITDFIPGMGTHEMIQFSKLTFASFTAMMSHTQQVGTNVVIADGAGDTLTLIGINIADVKSVDFSFI
jgi:large repetitive protein